MSNEIEPGSVSADDCNMADEIEPDNVAANMRMAPLLPNIRMPTRFSDFDRFTARLGRELSHLVESGYSLFGVHRMPVHRKIELLYSQTSSRFKPLKDTEKKSLKVCQYNIKRCYIYMEQNNIKMALKECTQSIANATILQPQLSHSHAIRGEALMKLEKYHLAVLELNRSLYYSRFDDVKRNESINWRTKCFTAMKEKPPETDFGDQIKPKPELREYWNQGPVVIEQSTAITPPSSAIIPARTSLSALSIPRRGQGSARIITPELSTSIPSLATSESGAQLSVFGSSSKPPSPSVSKTGESIAPSVSPGTSSKPISPSPSALGTNKSTVLPLSSKSSSKSPSTLLPVLEIGESEALSVSSGSSSKPTSPPSSALATNESTVLPLSSKSSSKPPPTLLSVLRTGELTASSVLSGSSSKLTSPSALAMSESTVSPLSSKPESKPPSTLLSLLKTGEPTAPLVLSGSSSKPTSPLALAMSESTVSPIPSSKPRSTPPSTLLSLLKIGEPTAPSISSGSSRKPTSPSPSLKTISEPAAPSFTCKSRSNLPSPLPLTSPSLRTISELTALSSLFTRRSRSNLTSPLLLGSQSQSPSLRAISEPTALLQLFIRRLRRRKILRQGSSGSSVTTLPPQPSSGITVKQPQRPVFNVPYNYITPCDLPPPSEKKRMIYTSNRLSLKKQHKIIPFGKKKRYLKALSEIPDPGDILAVVEPYATMLLEENFLTHCSHCAFECPTLIQCPTCAQALFCCLECREAALQTYHRVECQYLTQLVKETVDEEEVNKESVDEEEVNKELVFTLLALRALLIFTEQGDNLKTLIESRDPNHKFDTEIMLLRDGILRLKGVKPVEDSVSYNISEYLDKVRTATLEERIQEVVHLLYILKTATTYYDTYNEKLPNEEKVLKDSENLTEIEIFVGCVLCELLLITQNGSQGIKSSVVPQITTGTLVITREKDIGYTICPFKFFFRQSCDPNANVVNFKNYLYIYATQPIKENEWITLNFKEGYDYWFKEKSERTEALKTIFAKKRCKACDNNWPEKSNLKSVHDTRTAELLETTEEKFCMVWNNRWQDEICSDSEDLRIISRFSKMLYKNVKEPHFDFVRCKLLTERVICQQVDAELKNKNAELEIDLYTNRPNKHPAYTTYKFKEDTTDTGSFPYSFDPTITNSGTDDCKVIDSETDYKAINVEERDQAIQVDFDFSTPLIKWSKNKPVDAESGRDSTTPPTELQANSQSPLEVQVEIHPKPANESETDSTGSTPPTELQANSQSPLEVQVEIHPQPANESETDSTGSMGQ